MGISLAITLLGTVALLAHTIWLGMQSGPAADAAPPTRGDMRRHTLWYSFYLNPDDPRGWVEKPYGWGWTVNFRSMRQVRIFLALLTGTLVGGVLVALTAPAGS